METEVFDTGPDELAECILILLNEAGIANAMFPQGIPKDGEPAFEALSNAIVHTANGTDPDALTLLCEIAAGWRDRE